MADSGHSDAPTGNQLSDRLAAGVFAVAIHLLVLTLAVNAAAPVLRVPALVAEAPEPIRMSLDRGEPDQPPADLNKTVDQEPTPEVPPAEPTPLPAVDSTSAPPVLTRPIAAPLTTATTNPLEELAGLAGGSFALASGSGSGTGAAPAAARTGVMRARLLRANGGGPATEAALERGLAWLASVQDLRNRDKTLRGRWDCDRFMTAYVTREAGESDEDYAKRLAAEGPGFAGHDLGLTALAGLAFTGAGYSAESEKYGTNVAACVSHVAATQDVQGCFLSQRRDSAGNTYDHALSLLFLADHAQLAGLADGAGGGGRVSLQQAVNFLARTQHVGGGWDYQCYPAVKLELADQRSDQSITGFCIMALMACKSLGLEVPETTIARAVAFLRAAAARDGTGLYADRGTGAGRTSGGMTAVNFFCRRLLGEPETSDVQKAQQRQLLRRLPAWPRDASTTHYEDDPYPWYYASLAMLMDGSARGAWAEYNIAMKDALLGAQEKGDDARGGSWPPTTHYSQKEGGRVYATAISCLCLEVYYRYAPEYLRAQSVEYAGLWK